MKKMTIITVIKNVKEALEAQGLKAPKIEAEWLGEWCLFRDRLKGQEPDAQFRCARVTLSAGDGCTVIKSFTAETDGSWTLR